ncbi:YtpR family tRNA-binding protein [[Mycoplasma] imitans]|uniref:YtpR family tRNA-binding protein n=1 Tax=[Mycoplasma] imitans TaxID=29560 RepID=UPI000489DB32|nr:tRNA-binding protein [[Mycoplasma] imitans]
MQVTLYYSLENLQDTMIGYLKDPNTIRSKKQFGNIIYFYDENDQIVSFNILNVSQDQKLFSLIKNNGLVFLNEDLKKHLLSQYLTAFESLESPFVIGQVIEVNPIPNTHLNHCLVDVAKEQPLSIVCGGSNVSKGIKVVVVKVDGFINTGKHIKRSELFNLESSGMICSENELVLTNIVNDDRRILVLDGSVIVGQEFQTNNTQQSYDSKY